MTNINFKFDSKKFEKAITKEINEAIEKTQKELIIKKSILEEGKMQLLPKREEEMLKIVLEKYIDNPSMQVSGSIWDLPKHMQIGTSNIIKNLKLYGYFSSGEMYIGGDWYGTLTPEAFSYFNKKGMRKELFEELTDSNKTLLRELIEAENSNKNIIEILNEKINNDETDNIVRGRIGTLSENGLINVKWADNLVYYAELTDAGRTYNERERNYLKYMENQNKPIINIGEIHNTGSFVLGNAINSNLSIDNRITSIEQRIHECDDDEKQELLDLLTEVKDYIENIQNSKSVGKNKGLFTRLGNHLSKHSWFYKEVISLLGEVCLKIMGS